MISLVDIFFSHDARMHRIMKIVREIAPTDIAILIEGETGTGKELLAHFIHQQSRRKDKPFIKVNCAAIPGGLLESECFGFEKGAFTGADFVKPGKFELANEGSILLNDVAEMDIAIQGKLLQVLQDGQFSRLGGATDIRVDTRVISTTNHSLPKSIEEGRFREDLYYRLNAMSLTLPPLRERRDQIPPLVRFFIESHGRRFERPISGISTKLMKRLTAYDWPGNIRELDNVMKRVVLFGEKEIFFESAVCWKTGEGKLMNSVFPRKNEGRDLNLKKIKKDAAHQAERKLILQTLAETRWNRKEAAKLLRISYKTMLYKIDELARSR